MKLTQVEHYAQRIERVLRHIEENEAQATSLSLDDLASVAAISPFHFHRVFRLMTGCTVLECLTRAGFARTVKVISESGTTLEDAAAASGYASAQSFSRSIKAFTGASANQLRNDAARMAAFRHRIERGILPADGKLPALEIRIVHLEPLRFLALRNTGAYEKLSGGFGRLYQIISDWAGPETICGIHGLWPDDPATSSPVTFRFDCGFAVSHKDQPPAGVRWVDAPTGACLSVRHVGNYKALLTTVDLLYAKALAEDIELRDAPLFTHYLDDPEEVAEQQLRTDVYLPVDGIPV